MGWSEYNLLSSYKGNLSNGSSDVFSVNKDIDNLNEQFNTAVKGDYYGVSSSDFSAYKESSPDNDIKILSSKNYIQNEMDAIKRDIEAAEAARKAAEAKAAKIEAEKAEREAESDKREAEAKADRAAQEEESTENNGHRPINYGQWR